MKYIKLSILLLLIIFGCRGKDKVEYKTLLSKTKETVNKKKYKKIFIHGKSDDKLALKYINLMHSGYLFSKDYMSTKRTFVKDSIFIEIDSIFKPQSFTVLIFGDSSSYFATRIYVVPGDTISFKIKNKKLVFEGKNANYSNFFTAVEKETLLYRDNPYKGNIEEYKKRVKSIYNQRLLFFNKYQEKNKFSSTEQIDLIKDILKFEYLRNLISPRSIHNKRADWYVHTSEGVLSVMDSELTKQEQLFDLSDYLDNTTIEDFKRPDLLVNTDVFKNTFDAFIRYYFANNDYLNYSGEAFIAQKEFIQKNFDDDLEYYAIARMIREYNVRGFGYSTENIDILKNTISEYDSIFSKRPSYKEKMDDIKNSLDNFNFELSVYALNTKLLNIKGDTTTLKEIFSNTKSKIKVLDFWASWCPPCIIEITSANRFRNKLSDQDNVEFIYLSIDKDKNKWLKKSNQLKEYFNTKQQYLVLGGINSSLGNTLKISGVPKYVIFDKKEHIVLDNAPRPSDSLVFKKIIDKINLGK